MEILVSGGAKVEAKNVYSITPLFVAAQSGQLEALRFLAKHGELSQGTLARTSEVSWEGKLCVILWASSDPGPCRAFQRILRLCLGSVELL